MNTFMHTCGLHIPTWRCYPPFTAASHCQSSQATVVIRRRGPAHTRISCSNDADADPKGVSTFQIAEDTPGSEPDRLDGQLPERQKGRRRQADSTDWVASQLTRRFGCVGRTELDAVQCKDSGFCRAGRYQQLALRVQDCWWPGVAGDPCIRRNF